MTRQNCRVFFLLSVALRALNDLWVTHKHQLSEHTEAGYIVQLHLDTVLQGVLKTLQLPWPFCLFAFRCI